MSKPDDKVFVSSVIYFWQQKGDPERYTHFDHERCRQLMPAFYSAWRAHKTAEDVLNRVAESYIDAS